MKLNSLKLAVSAAIVSALSLSLLTIAAVYLGRGVAIVRLLIPILPGYTISLQGAGWGFLYGLAISFLYVVLVAEIYNGLLPWKGIKIKAGKKAKPIVVKKKKK